MENIVKISNSHSSSKNATLNVNLLGTNPIFGYIWIDDVMYSLSKSGKGHTFKLKKVK